jgi:sorbitol-specific phosphotransferase system component IIBC
MYELFPIPIEREESTPLNRQIIQYARNISKVVSEITTPILSHVWGVYSISIICCPGSSIANPLRK